MSGAGAARRPAVVDKGRTAPPWSGDLGWAGTGIDLDNNATTRPLPEALDEMCRVATGCHGNPSSAHGRGRDARRALEEARERVAALVGAETDEVVFTSGGTESNNLALHRALDGRHRRVVTTAAEHSSVGSKAADLRRLGVSVEELPAGRDGLLDPAALEAALAVPADLVSVHWVNSETGVLQPVGEIARLCEARGVALHVDAAQAAGRLPVAFRELPVAMMTLSAHKLHGPQGVGALCVRRGLGLPVPLMHGGDQERGWRPGTQNLPGIAGFGKAAEIRLGSLDRVVARLRGMRDAFEREVLAHVPGASVNGDPARRVCNTSNIRFAGVDGEALMARLDREGLSCSQGSACASMRPEPSHVLRAMGLTEDEAHSSVRFSFSALNAPGDASRAAGLVAAAARSLAGSA